MWESYGQNQIRAQARANLLNQHDAGWIVERANDEYVVRHDGRPAPQPQGQVTICIERRKFNKRRVDFHLKCN